MKPEMQLLAEVLDGADDLRARFEQPLSRRQAVGRLSGSATAVALAASPIALAAFARRAFADAALPDSVVDVLNFALLLEMLEAEFYNRGMAAAGLIPTHDREVFEQIRKHENAHVAFLKGVLGHRARAQARFDFTAGGRFRPFHDYTTFLILSQAFEDTGVRAYKGQAPNLIYHGDILTAALRIHSVEARHASEVRRIRGEKGWIPEDDPLAPAPIKPVYAGEQNTVQLGIDVGKFAEGYVAATEAFDEPLDRHAVLAIAGQFVVS